MILIADSGATKTDWVIMSGLLRKKINTQGINPFHQTRDMMAAVVKDELIPQLESREINGCDKIFFYGAGCLPAQSQTVKAILENYFTQATVEVETDLTGAARALCKNRPGIACILGTGANSCEYDGYNVTKHISPLGYILGDEGSGAYLGKRFVADCLKGILPLHLKEGLMEEYGITYKDILQRVYREPQANRFLASFTPYIYKHKHEESVKNLLTNCFKEFVERNLATYDRSLKVSFTGSVSWYFQHEITEVITSLGYTVGTFCKNPIDGLTDFHAENK